MLLVIDIGNTNTVIGLYEGDRLLHHWRLRTERDATEDELYLAIRNMFSSRDVQVELVDGVIISCVVPPMKSVFHNLCVRYFDREPVWVDSETPVGMPILYDNPKEVGADRIVNAVAGFHKYRCCLIIVDFGTATTFDCVSREGAYLGGAISPGIAISAEALFERASKLPRVEILDVPDTVIAKETASSMRSGIVLGHASLVDGMVARIKREMAGRPRVIATGGLAGVIARATETIEAVEPHLTLDGLRIIYDMVAGKQHVAYDDQLRERGGGR